MTIVPKVHIRGRGFKIRAGRDEKQKIKFVWPNSTLWTSSDRISMSNDNYIDVIASLL